MSVKASTMRSIGNDHVAAISFGAMGMSAFYDPSNRSQQDEATDIAELKKVIDAGCCIDTADMYGDKGHGENEEYIAKVGPEYLKKAFIATKFGNTPTGVQGSPEYIRQAVEKSLKRLQRDSIDLYYQHRVDPKVPIEDSVRTMQELQQQGKIKYIGLSEANESQIRRAAKVAKIDALQIELSPFTPMVVKNGILKCCEELGITLVAYSPLGRGLLTGNIKSMDDLDPKDWRRKAPRFSEHFDHNIQLVHQIKALADKKGSTPGQISLAWVLAQGPHVIAIPGTKREKYFDENAAAANIVLSKEELKEIDEIVYGFETKGARYPNGVSGYVEA